MIGSADLVNRMEEPMAPGVALVVPPPPPPPGPTLAERIAAARQLAPHGRDLHCADCWRRGRDAALRAIEAQ